MPRRVESLLIAFAALWSVAAAAQTVPLSVNCRAERLDLAERETCKSSDLMQLTTRVDGATKRLETTLNGKNREALLDTERPLRTQRNDCQNDPHRVHACVEHVLVARMNALTATGASPNAIRDQVRQYGFVDVPYFKKWDDQLVGRRIQIWGCVALEPASNPPGARRGFIGTSCDHRATDRVPVVISGMTEENTTFYAKQPTRYWTGMAQRQDGRIVLRLEF